MSVSPELGIDGFVLDDDAPGETSATFRFDFETNRITNEIINGLSALEQFIYLTLRTRRFIHPIYTSNIGEEVYDTIADKETTTSFKKAEIPRLIEEALLSDDRIERVYGFVITEIEDSIHVEFEVDTVEGSLFIREVY